MKAALQPSAAVLLDDQKQAVQQACQRIAPAWPLDQMIAVNPWWELRDRSLAETSALLAALARAHCLMPKDYFAELWSHQIQRHHLQQAARLLGETASVDDLLTHLRVPERQSHWHNVSDWLDSHRDRQHRMAWRDEITYQISQFCVGFFQPGGPFNADANAEQGLYRDWLEVTRQDRGLEILMAEPKLRSQFAALPDEHEELLAQAFDELAGDQVYLADYLHALLLDINGWASWVAYRRWQARLDGQTEYGLMVELLAVRLGWELALWRHCAAMHTAEARHLRSEWQQQWTRLPQIIDSHRQAQRLTWVWQRAAELSYQEELHTQLRQPPPYVAPTPPVLQAAFCIDVRSEPMRRALEAQHPAIETLGFAGFFGLPLEYQPVGSALQRPQLPGLLKPTIQIAEGDDPGAAVGEHRQKHLNRLARWQELNDAPPATFSLIEATGLRYAFKLLKDSFIPGAHRHPVNDLPQSGSWLLSRDGAPLTLAEKTELAAGILGAMGLTKNFAPLVLLVGHGSQSRNNPHAAGLDCGACGGQTGEINVRVLAQLLNEPTLRESMSKQGIIIPEQTRFVAALHNTTTDDIDCFDAKVSEQLSGWLKAAGQRVRQERAAKLDLHTNKQANLTQSIRRRAGDWSQVRPEWGLANNACFIVAPRLRTRHLDFAGRSFLHDYEWRQDQDFKVLELIMTAPMVVTHWINMQYNASVSDNLKYGSGNKVLHNVVGGNLGVFEGNGGDLRIGLPLQCLHNGRQWMHQPLRLSVYLAAPREAIADIVERHEAVAQLINHDWLYVFQWDIEAKKIAKYYKSKWHDAGVSISTASTR
ncbi:YbcC family protein [Nitrococcus mobilis]|uniref:Probable inorganic carbon transporter subunit DabA n=1 Tax=Nitrococcus mobilis Nb-231 TaxID=314278 RepID=A4BLU1_9GAMM|nr:DUF2309 domain-containing protein [Nitrococcus mobilis]EAR23279.1 hypothetical protein NB231_15703 [Nitrococcus mobilis Nb-231]